MHSCNGAICVCGHYLGDYPKKTPKKTWYQELRCENCNRLWDLVVYHDFKCEIHLKTEKNYGIKLVMNGGSIDASSIIHRCELEESHVDSNPPPDKNNRKRNNGLLEKLWEK